MAIKEKPTQVDVEEFIAKGGSVAKDEIPSKVILKKHLLEMPSDIFEKVNQHVKDSRVFSRNGWIVQAIMEKLEKDSSV